MFYELTGERFRELVHAESGSWVVSYDEPGAPRFVSASERAKFTKTEVPAEYVTAQEQGRERTKGYMKRHELIEPLLSDTAYITDSLLRKEKVYELAEEHQTTAKRIYRLFYRHLAGKPLMEERKVQPKEATAQQKDFAWAVETFYYSAKKVSLKGAYDLMLLARYMDEDGHLKKEYPSWHSFRHYFYDGNCHRKARNEIARNGLSNYQRNHRVLCGTSKNWKDYTGAFQMDATQADIYLVSRLDRKEVVGRPYVYLAVDTATQLIAGIHVGMEAGEQAVASCLANAAMDKVEFCRRYGIEITKEEWPNEGLPGEIITDKGREFIGNRMSELAVKFGIEFESLPPFRPDEKGLVEKAFDLIQQKYKPELRGKGVIEADAQERWAVDYRKQAVLTLEEFTSILIYCVLYLNSSRVIESASGSGTVPTASGLWQHYESEGKSRVIPVDSGNLYLLGLPRVKASLTRKGITCQDLCYIRKDYQKIYEQRKSREKYLVAYDTEDVSRIYMIDGTEYLPFELAESYRQYAGITRTEYELEKERQKEQRKQWEQADTEGRIRVFQNIKAVVSQAEGLGKNHPDTESRKQNQRKERV